MNEISITVRIADRQYKLTIDKEEEEIFRKATKIISDKLIEYAQNYAFKDKQDLLAMVALQYTTSSLKYEEDTLSNNNELIQRLNLIDELLIDNTK